MPSEKEEETVARVNCQVYEYMVRRPIWRDEDVSDVMARRWRGLGARERATC
jgi:hypothetical protein